MIEALPKTDSVRFYLMGINAAIAQIVSEKSPHTKTWMKTAADAQLALSNIPFKSVYSSYLRAELFFYRAAAEARRGNYTSAAFLFRNSYKRLQKTLLQDAQFIPAKGLVGTIEAFVSTLPTTYQRLLKIVGIESNLNIAIDYVQSAMADKKLEHYNWTWMSKIYWAEIQVHVLNDKNEAWQTMLKATENYEKHVLKKYFRASLALKLQKNETVLQILKVLPANEDKVQVTFLYYLKGCALLNKVSEETPYCLENYIKNYKGDMYKKSACQKLSWYYLLQGKKDLAEMYRQKISTTGNTLSDEDRHAAHYGEGKITIDNTLLRARLLCDGGYFNEALKVLENSTTTYPEKSENLTEYYYRRARILSGLNRNKEAIRYYFLTIEQGADLSVYYASYAALEIAYYFEELKSYQKAHDYYKTALSFTANEQYKESIEQKGRAGLRRTKGKY